MMLMMKYDVEPFSNLQFRRALNHAIDKETLINTVLEGLGQVTHQVTPETWFGHDPGLLEEDMYPYDPERAEQLIDESGYANEEITLAVPQGRYLKDSEVGQAIAGQLDALSNLSVDVEIREWSTHRDLIAPEYDEAPAFHFFGFGSAPNDASIKIDRNFTCGRLDTDFSIFCDEDIDALSQEAAETLDVEERREILQEANRVVMEKAACVPIYFQAALYGANTDVVDFTPIPKEEIYWFSMET
jgi:peptide/nickel transport system substrate-binding protein